MSQLVLNKLGSRLSVTDGMFQVSAGEDQFKLAAGRVTGILLNPGVVITYEAVSLAIEHDIDIIFVKRNGETVGRVWGNRFGSIATIRRNQIQFAGSAEAVNYIKTLIRIKLDGMCGVLQALSLIGDISVSIESVLKQFAKTSDKITVLDAGTISAQECFSTIRGYEGSASATYFRTISQFIPEKYRFEKRSQHPAKDQFNALLNYAYGMLYSKVESAAVKAGLDPFLGIMHRDEYNRPVLTYDLIEPYRPWADFVVANLCLQGVFYDDFFTEAPEGGI